MKQTIYGQLTDIAFRQTTPFCYGCYVKAPSGTCPICHSDDLMRHLERVGVEWGTDWIIGHLLEQSLEPVDIEEHFEEFVLQCYPETTKVGWLTLDSIDILKTYDKTAWELAESEYRDELESEEQIFTFDKGSTYYWRHDLEDFIAGGRIDIT